ncbi:hypothetical protein K9O30_07770 [Clostridium bowmanii]|uniref:hypothetical protein n=1 Tax=Clostridium bowmanii TaxID=132925 RepID=UPI001C0C4070|nr:hypothetical protein [Clostridium bowmanii]MBU3188963.1 hypothetical protein [Clostridium bowmanii]MCA1073626.1 hypothetical protein [Clostridium bowmanii]
MYAKGYKRLSWAMVFISFNVNIINILPDFIGYIFIYSSLCILSSQHKLYEKGKIPVVILILLTLNDIWNDPSSNVITGEVYNVGLLTLIIASIAIIIKIYLICILCMGVYELCKERGLNELMESSRVSMKFYLIISLIYLACAPFSINLYSNVRIVFLIIVGIIQMCAGISVALVFKKCKGVLI